jgi:hypothetical protein
MKTITLDVAQIARDAFGPQRYAAPEVAREPLTIAELADRTVLPARVSALSPGDLLRLAVFERAYAVEVMCIRMAPGREWIASTTQHPICGEYGRTRDEAVVALWQAILDAQSVGGVS